MITCHIDDVYNPNFNPHFVTLYLYPAVVISMAHHVVHLVKFFSTWILSEFY
jgi:hypothetical protein